mmetsp:Transcript_26502/g.85737  ORF Transcript_26502/g.85737 Transcript_26502/m.85737 type:complete len:172 (+) Transcript_26502:23-538(+)
MLVVAAKRLVRRCLSSSAQFAEAAAAVKKKPIEPMKRERIVDEYERAYGTGKRKTAIARVWVWKGTGTVTVNSMPLIAYFPRISHCEDVVAPFVAADVACEFDMACTVRGGGKSGQAGAVRHGVARALQNFNPDLRPPLKEAGFIRRDARIVERKKPGRKKARKMKQWVKR